MSARRAAAMVPSSSMVGNGSRLEVPFEYEDRRGTVAVTCVPSDVPALIGKDDSDRGFPVCTATVDIDAKGYFAFCGWVQMVRSTDNSSGGREFEMDPLGPFADNPSPFCFFGLAPTLFDAPSRPQRGELAWLAHSFLAVLDTLDDRRAARPLVGFEWGFNIAHDNSLELHPLGVLGNKDWDFHLPVLRQTYPTWSFGQARALPS